MEKRENIFKGKTIVLGLTGALTCFKVCPLILQLKRLGARFRLIATENALNFITKTTLQTLAKTEVLTTQFNPQKFDENHKPLTEEGDIFLLAPATANIISKVARGAADDLLSSVLCAWQKPLIVVPAMNPGMWANTATQENITALKKRGATIISAEKGAFPKTILIYQELEKILKFHGKLKGKNVLITCGNIKEKCGDFYLTADEDTAFPKTLADFLHLCGAKVTVVSDKTFTAPYQQIQVKDSKEFKEVVTENLANANIFLHTAKLLPYTLLKSENVEDKTLSFTLQKTEDVFDTFLQNRKPNQVLKVLTEEDLKNKTPQEILENILS